MKKQVFTLIALFALGGFSLIKAQVSPFVAGRLQFTLDSVCTKYKIKGASAAVLIPNMGIWKGTSGISETGVPITSDMLFGMGSNTKTHISATLLKMQEQQLLSLDDTIGKWITGFPNIGGKITIRQCLNHTSGLYDYLQSDAVNDSIFGNPSKIWQPEEILTLALAPNFNSGTGWSYSNTNYIIAGIIIKKVMNQPAFEVVKSMVLTPSELTHTFPYGEQGTQAVSHPWSMSMNVTSLTDMTTTPFLDNLFSLANTAGSLITTADDNVQFWHKLTSGQIVNAQSWKEMTTTKSIGGGDGYGLGIFLNSRKMNGRTYYSHGGTFFGYINENMVDTLSGVTIAVLTNQDSVNNNGLSALVLKSLHKVILTMPATGLSENQLSKEQVLLYPNPAAEKVTVQFDGFDFSGMATLIDITGKEVFSESISGKSFNLNTVGVNQGLYFLKLTNKESEVVYTTRLQIVH